MASKTHKTKGRIKPWTEFIQVDVKNPTLPDGVDFYHKTGAKLYVNSRYQVTIRKVNTGFGSSYQLSIRSVEGDARHDWRDFQRIKNELVGSHYEAVELYPSEDRLVDTCNQYFLYCFDFCFPFGYHERLVSHSAMPGTRQRPWEPGAQPADCINLTIDIAQDFIDRHRDIDPNPEAISLLTAPTSPENRDKI